MSTPGFVGGRMDPERQVPRSTPSFLRPARTLSADVVTRLRYRAPPRLAAPLVGRCPFHHDRGQPELACLPQVRGAGFCYPVATSGGDAIGFSSKPN